MSNDDYLKSGEFCYGIQIYGEYILKIVLLYTDTEEMPNKIKLRM